MYHRLISIIILFVIIFFIPSNQAKCQFGKNKVQYQDFNWKYIESKNFDVYYYQEGKSLAEFTAIEAEKALISIQNTLNYRLTKRISLIVYQTHNEFQQTNVIYQFMSEGIAGVTELMKNRVVIPFQGDYAQYRHTVHHELVHAVINDMFYGGNIQTAIGTGRYNMQFPLWMNEGLAEFESTGGYNIQTDVFMRDVSISGELKGLKNLDGYYAYRGGQAFYWYVADKYGKQKISDLINRLRIIGNVDATFKSAFNMSFEDFSDKFEKEFKTFYWPDIARFKDVSDFSVRLTNAQKDNTLWNSSPSISPDGEKMAYISAPDRNFAIYIRNIESKDKKTKELVSSLRQQDFEDLNILTPGISWNPTGTKLAISAKSGGEDAIYIVDAKNGDYDKIKLGINSIGSVQWSHNGEYLAFIGVKNGQSDVFIYDLKTEIVTNLTNDIFSDGIPVWDYDSKRLFFISDRGENINGDYPSNKMWNYNYSTQDIYSIDINTKIISRHTFSPEFEKSSIAVAKDDNKLLYVSDDNGIGNIYVLDLKTGNTKPITNSLTGISQISLSQDNKKLLFTTMTNGNYDIFMIRYPFDVKLDSNKLPLTKYRESMLEEKKLSENIVEDTNKAADTLETQISYGDFELEFSRQEVVKPNPDANKQTDLQQDFNSKIDTTFIEKNYKISFSPDLVMGNPGYNTFYGVQGIAQFLFSDILGDHTLFFQANLLIDLRNSTFALQYAYLPKKIDYTATLYHSSAFNYKNDGYLYRFRSWGASVEASYPLDLFNRIECGFNWMNVSKDNIDVPTAESTSRMLFVPQMSYVHDDIMWGYLAPERGTRYNVTLRGSPKFSSNGRGFMTATGDFRYYLPLVSSFFNFALRGSAGISVGPDPQKFFMGGTENWINAYFKNGELPFEEPEDYAFMPLVWPMRGWYINDRSGSNFFLVNSEVRFPIMYALLAGPLQMFLPVIMGNVFFDIGSAWDGEFVAAIKDTATGRVITNDLLMSTGFGIRAVLLGLPIKLDIAWRNEFYQWSEPYYIFSLGIDW